jgi:hypothetical protein
MKLKIIKDVLGNSYISLIDFNDVLFDALLDFAKINITDFDSLNQNLLNRNGGNFHLTAFNVAECNSNNNIFNLFDIDINDLRMLGIGSISKDSNKTFFIVCQSDTINKIRLSLGLPFKDLHITIGFNNKDLFHARKNDSNIITINKLF